MVLAKDHNTSEVESIQLAHQPMQKFSGARNGVRSWRQQELEYSGCLNTLQGGMARWNMLGHCESSFPLAQGCGTDELDN